MDIHILPSNIANIIAAGEVVQRPASVVKELMENAVDAGATKISVIVEDAGRTLIQVIDNGCGMDPEEAVICFQRHATSKIVTAEDLQNIRTFGFRGEALPSIASVAQVTLKTRKEGADTGVKVTMKDATASDAPKQDIAECAVPQGCNFEVRDLFYNTPARRKFLKSDSAELKQIISEFTKVALPNPGLSFSLVSNGREIFRLGAVQTVKLRIKDIFGQQMADELLPLEVQTTVAEMNGFVSGPDRLRKGAANQYFFVNGRYFRSPYLNKAVAKAYENIAPEGTAPSYVLFIKVNPEAVDVNVHPSKTEIKFEDDGVIFNIVLAAVREALGRSAYSQDVLDFDGGGLPQMRNVAPGFSRFRPGGEPDTVGNPDFNPFESDGYPNRKEWNGPDEPKRSEGWYDRKPQMSGGDFSQLFDKVGEEKKVTEALVCGPYIICPGLDGMMLIDARRAYLRIIYEDFIEALTKNDPVPQTVLFPIEVPVGAENIPLLEQNRELLRRLGFEFSVFSASSITVGSIPDGLADGQMEVTALVFEVMTALNEEQTSIASSIYSSLAAKMAASASRLASLPHNSVGAGDLLRRLYACESPEFTPDGHKVVTTVKFEDLEKFMK